MSATAIARKCPVCDAVEATPYLQKTNLRLVRCRSCGMVYANPVPPDLASGEYYDRAGNDYYLSPEKLQGDYAPIRFDRELRLFKRHCPRGRVLDVGCSSGAFLFQLTRRFPGSYDVLGTDVSGPPLDYAESQGVPVARGNFLALEFGDRKFDGVTFWAVLEHLLEPRRFLERAWSILNPDGFCLVLVPNLRSLAARCLGSRYRYIYTQHLNYFTAATLTRLVAARFTIVETRSLHFNPLVILQDWRSGGAEVPNRERAALLKRTTAYKQSPLLKPVKALYHLTETVLGAFRLADNVALVLRRKN